MRCLGFPGRVGACVCVRVQSVGADALQVCTVGAQSMRSSSNVLPGLSGIILWQMVLHVFLVTNL